MPVQEIKTNSDKRVETGAVQFNDDWPGLFLRGDDAGYLGQLIHRILPCIENCECFDRCDLFMLAPTLQRIKKIIDEDVQVK